jgi:hypothetical protein
MALYTFPEALMKMITEDMKTIGGSTYQLN